MSKALSFLRNHLAVSIALLLVAGGGAAFGMVDQLSGHDRAQARVYACVKSSTHVMSKTSATRHCPTGSRKISWSAVGPMGAAGPMGPSGAPGPAGPSGARGATGATGATGQDASLEFAEFYALMPGDNSATVAAGADIAFPQDGPSSGAAITRFGVDSFILAAVGTYRVSFSVSVNEPGQLLLSLDGSDLPYTVVGRATGTSLLTGEALVTTTGLNQLVTVRNPAGNSPALTITPLAGGTRPVAATLIIEQLR